MKPAGQARVERRLAAILAADVVGYSRLIEGDEEGTLRRLKALRAEIIDPKIAEHRGRIVKTTGDGVNVAARLEGLAEPGGICISARVQEDVAGRLDLAFEDMGEQALKNITRPVRVYRVRDAGDAARSPSALVPSALPLPDKPSIAVLPFANMSGDPEQEYFADGMVEEIITALSRIRWLFVI